MIVSSRDEWLRAFFVEDVRSRHIPPDLEGRVFRKLQMIDDAARDQDFADRRRLSLCHQHDLLSPVAMVVKVDILGLSTAAVPSKDQPPLVVDADRVEARQMAAELLEMIARRRPQVLIGSSVVDHLELPKQPAFEKRRDAP